MATLTLHDIPDELLSRLEQRAHSHGRSLNSEVLAALETLDTANVPPPADAASADHPATDASPMDDPSVAVSEETLAKIRATLARYPGSAKAAQRRRDPEEVRAELELFARLRSHFKGPPLSSEEIIAAIERESHPPELDRFGNRINPEF